MAPQKHWTEFNQTLPGLVRLTLAIAACYLPSLWMPFGGPVPPPPRRRPTIRERRAAKPVGSVFD